MIISFQMNSVKHQNRIKIKIIEKIKNIRPRVRFPVTRTNIEWIKLKITA